MIDLGDMWIIWTIHEVPSGDKTAAGSEQGIILTSNEKGLIPLE
jgi:hypothetical protein